MAGGLEDVEGIGGEAVVDAAAVGAANFVNVDVLAVGKKGELRHSRTGREVVVVADIVNKRRPREEVLGGLVDELLAILGVSLVRVVADELVLVHPGKQLVTKFERLTSRAHTSCRAPRLG